jgi:hypothetical protein
MPQCMGSAFAKLQSSSAVRKKWGQSFFIAGFMAINYSRILNMPDLQRIIHPLERPGRVTLALL